MDALIRRFDATRDGDLMLCESPGIAYQPDARPIPYDDGYFAKVAAYEGSAIAHRVNAGRVALLKRHLPDGTRLLDIGAGTGAFVREARQWGLEAYGCEVMAGAIDRLRADGIFAECGPQDYPAVTCWDVIEHMDCPEIVLRSVRKGAHLFASVPVFDDLTRIRESRHYRPHEHLQYFTAQGFVDWMALYGFRCVEQSDHEISAGRDSIGAFAFVRDLPDYQDHVAMYQQMHASRYYGGSATELHLDTVAELVRRLKPASILDYGCGRSDIAAHFWRDGARRIARFDPAIPEFERVPEGCFDLALVCDLMEHVPMAGVDRVLGDIRAKAATALFTISTKLARAKLPDGRNAHVTILTADEWTRWIADYFGRVERVPSKWEHEVVLLAGCQ